jgi:hypothetical protein
MSFGFGFGFPRRAAAGGAAPSLNFDFTSLTSLPSRITFSRTSNATLTDSNGRVAYAPHNLLTNSEDFEASAWVKSNVTISANSAVAPDGTTTADKFIADAVNTLHYIQLSVTAISNIAVGTIYVKLDGSNVNKVTIYPGGSATFALFDLQTLTATREANCLASSITPLNDGWYRLTAAWPASVATDRMRFYAGSGATGDAVYTGNGVNGIFIWGAQLNVANAPVNLLTFSEQFDNAAWGKSNVSVTANTAVAPDGAVTADLFIPDTVSTQHRLDSASTAVASSTTYTASVYGKAGAYNFLLVRLRDAVSTADAIFNLANGATGAITIASWSNGSSTITAVGDGWYRCTFTATSNSAGASAGTTAFRLNVGNPNSNGDLSSWAGNGTDGVFLWGAQLNTGSTALPYVATTSSIYLPPSYNSTTPKNLLGFTQEFDNAAWTKSNSFVQTNLLLWSDGLSTTWGGSFSTLTANYASAPDGAFTASRLVGTNATTWFWNNTAFTPTIGTTYTISCWVKRTGAVNQTFRLFFAGNNVSADLTATDQWQRFTFTTSASATLASHGIARDSANNGADILVWGAQLVQGSVPGDYQVTTSAAAAVQYSDPNGTRTADALIPDTVNAQHNVRTTISNYTAGATITVSAYVKANGYNFVGLVVDNSQSRRCFDLVNGAAGVSGGIANTPFIASVGNGWFRIAMTFTSTLSGNVWIAVMNSNTDPVNSFAGDGTSGIYIWGAQLSNSASVDPYVYNPQAAPTSTAYYGPRFDYNPVTLAANGLLIEEQKSNLMLWSEDCSNAAWAPTNLTITSNSTTSPAGLVNAQRLTTTAATNTSVLQDAVVNATAATFSVYVKIGSGATDLSTFVLRNQTTTTNLLSISFNYSTGAITYNTGSSGASATDVGNGWWRIVLTATSGITAGNAIRGYVGAAGGVQPAGVFIFAWGAQLEAGSFATSYIATQASQVTRAADNASMLGDNFATWYSATEGTLVAEATPGRYGAGALFNAAAVVGFTDNTSNNRIYIGRSNTTTYPFINIATSGVTQVDVATSANVWNGATTAKVALAYKLNDVAGADRGNTPVTDTSATIPTVTVLQIGTIVGQSIINGHIRAISYYPTRLPNATLVSITA